MVRRLDIYKTRGVEHLYATGMSRTRNRSPHEAKTKPAKAKDKQTARFWDRLGRGCKYCKAIEHQKVLSGIVAKSDRGNQGTLGPLDPQIGVSDSDPTTPIDPSKTFNRT